MSWFKVFCKAAGIENTACMSWKAPGMSAVQVVKGKYEMSKQRGPTPTKFIYCCMRILRQAHWHPWSLPGAALGHRGRLPFW